MSLQSSCIPADNWKKWGKPHLEGINQLLATIYRRRIRFSEILQESGVETSQIEVWRKDKAWIIEFCERFERELVHTLRERFPVYECRVLNRTYIDGWTQERTASEYSIPAAEIQRTNRVLLKYLRSKPGKKKVKYMVLQAADALPENNERMIEKSAVPASDSDVGVLVGQFQKTGEMVIYDPTQQRGIPAGEVYLYRIRYGRMARFEVEITYEEVKRIENEAVRTNVLRVYQEQKRRSGGRFRLMTPKGARYSRVATCWNCQTCLDTEQHELCQKCGWIKCPVCGACGCGYEKE
jgi:hypothetical protein